MQPSLESKLQSGLYSATSRIDRTQHNVGTQRAGLSRLALWRYRYRSQGMSTQLAIGLLWGAIAFFQLAILFCHFRQHLFPETKTARRFEANRLQGLVFGVIWNEQ